MDLQNAADPKKNQSLQRSRQSGFVLIVVLLGLSILSVLIGSSIKNMATHSKLVEISFKQDREEALFRGILELAGLQATYSLREGASSLPEQTFQFDSKTGPIEYKVHDIAGLVDLNTAPLELIERLLIAGQQDSQDVVSKLSDLREKGIRLQAVDDLHGMPGVDLRTFFDIDQFFTTYSGRRGIDPTAAPIELLALLTDREGTREQLIADVPIEWVQPPTRRIFAVSASKDNRVFGPRGTILVSTGATYEMRVLEVMR